VHEEPGKLSWYINWAMDWMIGNCGLICSMGKRFFCTPDYPYWFGGTPNPLRTRVLSLGVKWPQHEADHLPSSKASLRMVLKLINQHRTRR